jgi:hypothetical protein
MDRAVDPVGLGAGDDGVADHPFMERPWTQPVDSRLNASAHIGAHVSAVDG